MPNVIRLTGPALRFPLRVPHLLKVVFGAWLGCLLLAVSPNPAAAAPALSLVSGRVENTVISLVDHGDGTMTLDAVQSGKLSKFGSFTGEFHYDAAGLPGLIILSGKGTLVFAQGDTLRVTANVVEVGFEYPLSLTGTLTVTGGTGRFAGASGLLYLSGRDDEALTDILAVSGLIYTR